MGKMAPSASHDRIFIAFNFFTKYTRRFLQKNKKSRFWIVAQIRNISAQYTICNMSSGKIPKKIFLFQKINIFKYLLQASAVWLKIKFKLCEEINLLNWNNV